MHHDKSVFYNTSDTVPLKVGDHLMHSLFGRGIIVALDDTYYTIAFSARFGVKKVRKSFKGIRKVN